MKVFRLLFFVGLLAVILLFHKQPASHGDWSPGLPTGTATVSNDSSVPSKALQVLEIVRRTGQGPAGYVGGRVFQNREGLLPEAGSYREFDVDPKPEHGGRNAERIIVEWNTKKAWYTGDHYQTFTPMP